MDSNEDRLTMYSDYVCPFCYLGRKSLESYRERRDDELEVVWQPFDLRSEKRRPDGTVDHSIDDGKDEAYFEQVSENVDRLKQTYNAKEMLSLDELPDEIDSFDAQVASFYVQREYPELWDKFDRVVFEALWIHGRDIGSVEVLAELGSTVGIDPEEIRMAVADQELKDRVRDRFTEAQHKGIAGVPTFVYDEYVARGAVPPEQLRRLVEGG